MNSKGVIILLAFLSLIALFFFAPYIEFLNESISSYKKNQLIDHWSDDKIEIKIMLLSLFYPILLIIEATLWKNRKGILKRIVLLLQSILILTGGFFVWFVMSFHLFTGPYNYQLIFYLIIVYLYVGISWNLLLAIPFFDKNKLISNSFDELSLRKKTNSL